MNLNQIERPLNATNTKTIKHKSNTFIVANHEERGKNLSIEFIEANGNISLDFSKAKDYIVFGYNTNGALRSKHIAINGKGNFMIQTSCHFINLVLFDSFNKMKKQPMNNQIHPMWEHINATLKEKIEILSTNPYRYYIGANVWAFRDSRQEILQEYLKEAIAKEDYILCQKIKEVKTFVSFINEQHTNNEYLFLLETEETMWKVKVRYYVKKEGNQLNLYTTNDINEEYYDCDQTLKINDYLNKKDLMELIESHLDNSKDNYSEAKFKAEGLLNEKEFNSVIDRITEQRRVLMKLKILNIPEPELITLKKKYDKAFIKYWTAGSNPPKFQPIGMEEFKKRLENPEFFKEYGE